MAVPRSSSGSSHDARVPCPLCGGLIHPIAGRCKHCKADVGTHREARPPASAALPPLAPRAGADPSLGPARPLDSSAYRGPAAGWTAAPSPAHVAPNAMPSSAAPVSLPGLVDSGPVLPPRQTATGTAVRPSRWSNWPMIVIAIAAVMLAFAAVMLVWQPPTEAKASGRKLMAPPAPERMDTNPLPPQRPGTGADPWAPPRGSVPRAPQQPADPDDDQSSIDPRDPLVDPFASPRPPAAGAGRPKVNPYASQRSDGGIMQLAMQRMCRKAAVCTPGLETMCDGLDGLGTPVIPSCPAAKACLDAVERLDPCAGGIAATTRFTELVESIASCDDALSC